MEEKGCEGEESSPTIDTLLQKLVKEKRIKSERLISLFKELPLERLIPPQHLTSFLEDNPVPIYQKGSMVRTSGAPHMISIILELLELEARMRILILGGKGGFLETLVTKCVEPGFVYILEQDPIIAEMTEEALLDMNLEGHSSVLIKDPLMGLVTKGLFDRILITAQVPQLPPELVHQLKDNSWLLAPVGGQDYQDFIRIRREGDSYATANMGRVRFGPLLSTEATLLPEIRPPVPAGSGSLEQVFIEIKGQRVTLQEMHGKLDELKQMMEGQFTNLNNVLLTRQEELKAVLENVPARTKDTIAQLVEDLIVTQLMTDFKSRMPGPEEESVVTRAIREALRPYCADCAQIAGGLERWLPKTWEMLRIAETFHHRTLNVPRGRDCTPFVVCYFKSAELAMFEVGKKLGQDVMESATMDYMERALESAVKNKNNLRPLWENGNYPPAVIGPNRKKALGVFLSTYRDDRNGKLHKGLTSFDEVGRVRNSTYSLLTGVLGLLIATGGYTFNGKEK